MFRRALLLTTVLAPVVFLTARCSKITPDQAKTDVDLIASKLAMLPDALQSAGLAISADLMTQIKAAIAAIQAQDQTIASAITVNPSLFDNFSAAVNALVPLVQPFFAAAPQIGLAIQAAMALLQAVLASVHGTAAVGTKMTPAQARAVLHASF